MIKLVFALLTIESSYALNVEREATVVPDTVQFWLGPTTQWRVRTYAIDHDIHPHTLGRPFSADEAVAHIEKHYDDVISMLFVLEFSDPTDKAEITRVLGEHNLGGKIEVGSSGIAFYNPDCGEYRSKSQPR